jgi:hypothetical protein
VQGNRGRHGSTDSDDIGPYGARCRAFTTDLRRVDWPIKFWPDILEKYDGTIDPEEFLQTWDGGLQVMANYFNVALRGTARSWLMNLSPGSVGSWGELC